MKRWTRTLVFSLPALLLLASAAGAATVKEARSKMGSDFEVTAVAGDEAVARRAVGAAYEEIERIEALISSWRETSETSRLNDRAGQGPVAVSAELRGLIRRSLKVSRLTGGAFDITFASAGKLWDFKSAAPRLPDPEIVKASVANVDYRLVTVDDEAGTVTLAREGVRIGFGGIGKGYAANRAVRVMKEAGATSGLVNAGGDLLAFGLQEDGSPWTVAIADPLHRDQVFAYLEVTDRAVVTSGDYERFFEIDGVRYAHILDPRTGYPVRGIRSVTILCPDAELADALATATFVLGKKEGLQLLDQLKGVEGLIVDGEGRLHFSANLESMMEPRSNTP